MALNFFIFLSIILNNGGAGATPLFASSHLGLGVWPLAQFFVYNIFYVDDTMLKPMGLNDLNSSYTRRSYKVSRLHTFWGILKCSQNAGSPRSMLLIIYHNAQSWGRSWESSAIVGLVLICSWPMWMLWLTNLFCLSGDLTDAKSAEGMGSSQLEAEWNHYRDVLQETGLYNSTIWLDVRGNHGILFFGHWSICCCFVVAKLKMLIVLPSTRVNKMHWHFSAYEIHHTAMLKHELL